VLTAIVCFWIKLKRKKQGGLRLLIVSYPGLCMIIIGLSVIMMLMVWYFIVPNSGQKNSNPLPQASGSKADNLSA